MSDNSEYSDPETMARVKPTIKSGTSKRWYYQLAAQRKAKRNAQKQRVVVTHTEKIDQIQSRHGRVWVDGYTLNPGCRGVFPQLSRVAFKYVRYTTKACTIEFHPSVEQTSKETSEGRIRLVMLPPHNHQNEYDGGDELVFDVSKSATLTIECSKYGIDTEEKWVTTSNGDDEYGIHDFGYLYLECINIPRGEIAGTLSIAYTIEFIEVRTPTTALAPGSGPMQDFYDESFGDETDSDTDSESETPEQKSQTHEAEAATSANEGDDEEPNATLEYNNNTQTDITTTITDQQPAAAEE